MAIVIGTGDGDALGGAFEQVIKVRSEDTAGAMAVIEETVQPGKLVPPHTHQNDVWVYVLSGEIGVLVGEEIRSAGPGSWALKPRNVVHAMWNSGTTPSRIIEVLTPGGSERWFEELKSLMAGDRAGFEDACRRHGIAFLSDSPWIAELGRRFGVK